MFSENVITAISTLNKVVDMREHTKDLDTMTATNWKNEVKKRGPRSFDVVKKNTATGLGAEIALHSTGLFEQTSAITENAVGLSFAQRKRDVRCEEKLGEVKTMNAKYPYWYISESQCESVMYSIKFNDFFLIMAYEEIQGLKYRYRPKFLIDSKKLSGYIIKNSGPYSPYRFDHERAIKKNDCVDLWSAA